MRASLPPSKPVALHFDMKSGTLALEDVDIGQRFRVLDMMPFRHLPGDRVCIDSQGEPHVIDGNSPIPPNTIKVVPLETDLLALRLDREEDQWAILRWSREAIGDLLRKVALSRNTLLPLRRMTEVEKRLTIRVPIGRPDPQSCMVSGNGSPSELCGKPSTDTCTFCERPLCEEHGVMCLVLPTVMAGYCSLCLYFLEPLPLEQEATA